MTTPNLTEQSLLEHLFVRPGCTVAYLAQRLAVSTSTIISAIGRLQDKGLVAAGQSLATGRGRPSLAYSPRFEGPVGVCFIDGSQLAAAVFDSEGQLLAESRMEYVTIENRDHATRLACEAMSDVTTQAEIRIADLSFVALTFNALRTPEGVLSSSVLPWATTELGDQVASRLGSPVCVVVTSSMLLAEYQHMPDLLPDCLLSFSVGDGVSAHAVLMGKIGRGHNGLSGEIGHVTIEPDGAMCGCGRRGCVETVCSGPAIRRRLLSALSQGARSSLDAKAIELASAPSAIEQLWQAQQAGDAFACEFIDDVIDRIAWVLSMAIALHDPQLIRVRGYVLHHRQPWIDSVRQRVLEKYAMRGSQRDLNIEPGKADVQDVLRVTAYAALKQQQLAEAG